jgi:hypothetical protein
LLNRFEARQLQATLAPAKRRAEELLQGRSEPNEMARTEEYNRFPATPDWLPKFIVE